MRTFLRMWAGFWAGVTCTLGLLSTGASPLMAFLVAQLILQTMIWV